MIDDYEVDEKQEVAIITPAESPQEPEAEPSADDCMAASTSVFKIVAECLISRCDKEPALTLDAGLGSGG